MASSLPVTVDQQFLCHLWAAAKPSPLRSEPQLWGGDSLLCLSFLGYCPCALGHHIEYSYILKLTLHCSLVMLCLKLSLFKSLTPDWPHSDLGLLRSRDCPVAS